MKRQFLLSVVNRHRFGADPGPADPAWVEGNADPNADPTSSFPNFGKYRFFTFFSQLRQFTTFFFSHQRRVMISSIFDKFS
jgi:hypothetical protein